jgi:GDPmannose 4,6-dehydratase
MPARCKVVEYGDGVSAGARMKNQRALILGIGGQDGHLMSWFLVERGYDVTGLLLPTDMSSDTIASLPHKRLSLVQGSICDDRLINDILKDEKPEQIYNFAGISFIPYSWESPQEVARVNGLAVGTLLNAVRWKSPTSRVFQSCSSEMFGHNPRSFPQNETTPLRPDNPYGSSKVFAAHLVENYRSKFGIFACTGIMYNHESEWRSPEFVTRKVAMAAASISMGLSDSLTIGNLDARRDWSYAGDFIEGIWLMMSAREPKDYVLASGRLHSVRDVLNTAFGHVGLSWQDHVRVDVSLNRPTEAVPLCGDSALIRTELGWKPRMQFKDLIRMMVDKDLERLSNGISTSPRLVASEYA